MAEKEINTNEAQVGADVGLEKGIFVTERDDKALKFLKQHGTSGPVSPEDSKRILRIIDTHLLPMMILTLALNFMDKNALSYSVNFNLLDDLNMSSSQYSWASGSIFYLAYLVSQPVVGRLMQIFPLGRYLSVSVIIWGILLMCTAACKNFASLMVVRALLGCVESCINPAFMILTSMWYTRDEQPERTNWWNLGLSLGSIFGGLIGYGIGHIQYRDTSPWIWFFIIFGAITILYGCFLLYYLPDTPMNARWLSDTDKTLAVERIRLNKTGISNNLWKWYQFWECLRDPFTWFSFSIMVLGTIPSGGVSSFGSIVIKGFGFSSLNTTLLNMPLGVVQLISYLVAGRISTRWPNTRLHISWISQIPAIIGSVLLYKLPTSNKIGRLLSFYIIQTHGLPSNMGMAMISGNMAGYTKKTTIAAILFMGYCTGQVSGPQLFKADEAPVYRTAFIAFFVCCALLVIFCWIFQAYLMWENRRRDRLVAVEGLDPVNLDRDEGFHDLTDWEQKKTFRYVY